MWSGSARVNPASRKIHIRRVCSSHTGGAPRSGKDARRAGSKQGAPRRDDRL